MTTTPTTERVAWRETFLLEALGMREAIRAEGRERDAANLSQLAVALERSADESRNVWASHGYLRRAGRLSSTAFRLSLRRLIDAGLIVELPATTPTGNPVIHITDTTTNTGATARDYEHDDH